MLVNLSSKLLYSCNHLHFDSKTYQYSQKFTCIRWIFRCSFSLGRIFKACLLRCRARGMFFSSTLCLASDINIAYLTWSSSDRFCWACTEGEATPEVSEETEEGCLFGGKTPLLGELEDALSFLEEMAGGLVAGSETKRGPRVKFLSLESQCKERNKGSIKFHWFTIPRYFYNHYCIPLISSSFWASVEFSSKYV